MRKFIANVTDFPAPINFPRPQVDSSAPRLRRLPSRRKRPPPLVPRWFERQRNKDAKNPPSREKTRNPKTDRSIPRGNALQLLRVRPWPTLKYRPPRRTLPQYSQVIEPQTAAQNCHRQY
jgi:hypothetical protein